MKYVESLRNTLFEIMQKDGEVFVIGRRKVTIDVEGKLLLD